VSARRTHAATQTASRPAQTSTANAAPRGMSRNEIRSRITGVNVPRAERIASGALGGAAIVLGLRRRSLGGLAIAGLGAAFVVRALVGRCPLYRARALRKGIQVRRAITIQATPRQIYDTWRDLENLPRFLKHVTSVTVEEGGISHWVVEQGPARLSWRAEILEESPGKRLRWRSLPGGDLEHDGSIELRAAPGDRGTVVEVKFHYFPPGGLIVASALSGFLRKLTAVQIGEELARLQQLLETGEITTGARRFDDLPEEDRAIDGTIPQHRSATTRAQTSAWGTR
jgi:uncharacterized membrane protein